jgi:hypothetical protein
MCYTIFKADFLSGIGQSIVFIKSIFRKSKLFISFFSNGFPESRDVVRCVVHAC